MISIGGLPVGAALWLAKAALDAPIASNRTRQDLKIIVKSKRLIQEKYMNVIFSKVLHKAIRKIQSLEYYREF